MNVEQLTQMAGGNQYPIIEVAHSDASDFYWTMGYYYAERELADYSHDEAVRKCEEVISDSVNSIPVDDSDGYRLALEILNDDAFENAYEPINRYDL